MLYRILAEGALVVHVAFLVFVATGTLLAWRWPALVWVHLPALAWAAGTVTIGFPCPLTPLEKGLRRLAGDEGYGGGFVDHYIEDVIYPDQYSAALRALAVVMIVVGYVGLRRKGRASIRSASPGAAPGLEATANRHDCGGSAPAAPTTGASAAGRGERLAAPCTGRARPGGRPP